MTTGGGVLAPVVAGSVARAEGDAVDGGPYQRLGVRPLLNAAGILTRLGGSLPPPEVLAAMERASRQYVQIEELQAAAGRRIAELVGAEAALVTSGAAAALLVGTAACVTRGDPERIRRLPDTSGIPDEVIIQKAHRHEFEHAMRAAGVRLVEIETQDQLERAIGPRTAMMHFLAYAGKQGQIDAAAWIAVARKHSVPTFIDAAAELPPAANLGGYCKAASTSRPSAAARVCAGPQCTGLLLGSKDLVRAATLNNSPYPDSIGRGCKVAKEEIVGLVTAVELFLARDHEADRRRWQSIVDEWQAGAPVEPEDHRAPARSRERRQRSLPVARLGPGRAGVHARPVPDAPARGRSSHRAVAHRRARPLPHAVHARAGRGADRGAADRRGVRGFSR
jgi:L-seryl-tRNA(Ser) seleniumtransferase